MTTPDLLDRRERVIGHRGAARFAPENTLAGFRTAARYGVRWVEFDVRLTGCGNLALVHDAHLHRTTNGSGPVLAFGLPALRRLDAGSWFAAPFAGEHVPSFPEALALCTELGLSVHVEAKSDAAHAVATAEAVARGLREIPHHEVVVSSMEPEVLVNAARLLPDVPRALGLAAPRPDWPEAALALGAEAVHMDHEWLDDAALDDVAARRGDLRVRAFTVNLPDRAEELYARGVDAVFTDDPGRLLAPLETVTRSEPRDRRRPPAA